MLGQFNFNIESGCSSLPSLLCFPISHGKHRNCSSEWSKRIVAKQCKEIGSHFSRLMFVCMRVSREMKYLPSENNDSECLLVATCIATIVFRAYRRKINQLEILGWQSKFQSFFWGREKSIAEQIGRWHVNVNIFALSKLNIHFRFYSKWNYEPNFLVFVPLALHDRTKIDIILWHFMFFCKFYVMNSVCFVCGFVCVWTWTQNNRLDSMFDVCLCFQTSRMKANPRVFKYKWNCAIQWMNHIAECCHHYSCKW